MTNLADKIRLAIERLKAFEPEEGYYLAFSGGKDSVCIKALADMAGVRYDAHYNVTTVDPPELTRFIKKQFPDVIWNLPELPMRKLIVKKMMPPTRMARYCCEWLKERGGKGRVVITGVRWAESYNRKISHGVVTVMRRGKKNSTILNDDNDESRRMVEDCYRTQKTIVNPIIDWEDEDVWGFIHGNNLPYCSLYDEGFKRLGCVGCPQGGVTRMKRDFERWPQYRRMYVNAFDKMIAARIAQGKRLTWKTGEEVMRWWLTDKKPKW